MTDVEALMGVARQQDGLFRADQARSCGVSRDWISHRLGTRLSCILPRIYWNRTGPPPRSVLFHAALLYAGAGAALSHWSAAELWGFRSRQREEVHVTTLPNEQVRRVPGKLVPHRSEELGSDVCRVRRGRQLTSVERTLVDIAVASESRREVRAMTADVVQRGLTVPRRIAEEMSKRPGLPGLAALADILHSVSEGAHSVLEIELREAMREHRVPDSLADAPVVGASGRAYRVDNLWPGQKLIVEVDGREWHLSPDHWERDLERAADLIDAGYTVLRFTAAAIRRRTVQTVAVVARQLGRAAGPGV